METKPKGGHGKSRWIRLASNVFNRQVRGRHGRAGSKLLFLLGILMCFHIVNYGAIVYRLGHLVFIQASGVRFPVALPIHGDVGKLVTPGDCKSSASGTVGSTPTVSTKTC